MLWNNWIYEFHVHFNHFFQHLCYKPIWYLFTCLSKCLVSLLIRILSMFLDLRFLDRPSVFPAFLFHIYMYIYGGLKMINNVRDDRCSHLTKLTMEGLEMSEAHIEDKFIYFTIFVLSLCTIILDWPSVYMFHGSVWTLFGSGVMTSPGSFHVMMKLPYSWC